MKKFQRKSQWKSKISILLALVCAATMFFGSGMEVRAESVYNTRMFRYDISSIWAPSAMETSAAYKNSQEYPYVVISYCPTLAVEAPGLGYQYMLWCLDSPLYLNDDVLRGGNGIYSNARGYNFATRSETVKMIAFMSNDGRFWRSCESFTFAPGTTYYNRYLYVNNFEYYMMNFDLLQYQYDRVCYKRNISPAYNDAGKDFTGDWSDGDIFIDDIIPDPVDPVDPDLPDEDIPDSEMGFLESIRYNIRNLWKTIISIFGILNNSIVSDFKVLISTLTAFKNIIDERISADIVNLVTGASDIKTLLDTHIRSDLKSIATFLSNMTNIFKEQIVSDISNIANLISFMKTTFDERIVKDISNALGFLSGMKTIIDERIVKDISNALGFLSDMKTIIDTKMRSDLADLLTFAASFDTFIREGLFAGFEELLTRLFVPEDEFLQKTYDSMYARFPFFESARSIVNAVHSSLSRNGRSASAVPEAPKITIPISKTGLARFGLGDVVIDFSFFNPYRSTVLSAESAFIMIHFAYRMYFGFKSIIQATSSGGSVMIDAYGRGWL